MAAVTGESLEIAANAKRSDSRTEPNVTPLILTYNEEANIARALSSLQWAKRIVVLDSGSTDSTESIAKAFSNVDWYVRPFDSAGLQWEYGIRRTDILTDYVLALGADMAPSEEFIRELKNEFLPKNYVGGIVRFEYRLHGQPLGGSLLRPRLMLFNAAKVQVSQRGHTEEFSVGGSTYRFKSAIIHDDRKPIERWVNSQLSYSALEANRLLADRSLRWRDSLRLMGIMPPVAAILAYIRAGGPFRGAAAARYAYERATFESLLALRLISSRLDDKKDSLE